MLGWVGMLINKSWLDRQRYVQPSERRARCGPEAVREAGCRLIGGVLQVRRDGTPTGCDVEV